MQAGKNPEPLKKLKKESKNFSYQVEEYIRLPKPEINLDSLFIDVLNSRRSQRVFKKLTLKKISTLLFHSAKAKEVFISPTGSVLSHRASPSAGAIHPIDILISLPANLDRRMLLYYNPFTHRLGRLKITKPDLTLFLENINKCLALGNATLIWFAVHPDRTTNKYKNSESLIWRDAGALTMSVQLVASALKINSCPIGTLGESFFCKDFANKLVSGGGLLLG